MDNSGFTIKRLDEMERPWPKWSLARKSLGLKSFGMNVCHLEPGEQIPEHDEMGRDQEEVFVTLEGTRASSSTATRTRCRATRSCGSTSTASARSETTVRRRRRC
jgi:uncharacterized cupin superfamily protein